MKIIKEPKASDWSYTFTCKKCKAELEACASDVRHYHSKGDGPYASTDVYSVSCPVCHESESIQHTKMSAIVMIEAKNRNRTSSISSCQWDDTSSGPFGDH